MRSKIVLLYGATERVIDDGMCHINVFVRHVNLGFSRGAELDDPRGVLRGTGKAMRHITLKTLSDLNRPSGGPEARWPGATPPSHGQHNSDESETNVAD
jgi:hypothetical protein